MENQNFKGIQQSNVQIQRQVAYKCWLSNLNNGKFIAGVNTPENFTPAHLICNGKKISRVNVIATVVDTFKSEDGNYYSFTLDEGTSTIRMKAFNEDTKKLINVKKGDNVLVVGRIREYQGEIYISPEITKIITDPNLELIRRAELLKYLGKPEKEANSSSLNTISTNAQQQNVQPPKNVQNEVLRQKVLDLLADNEETGAEITKIKTELKIDDPTTEAVVNELLLEGEIYENKPGHYKAI
jgi:RecG-like helicase